MPLVNCTVTDGIAQVRLDRPDKLNALTLDTLDQLVETARRLRGDRSLRAVVLAGEGDAFCAGLDFASAMKDQKALYSRFVPRPWRGTNVFQEAAWAWRRVPVPVIAAVHGHCLGGGLQLALAADFRYATTDSTWSVLEGKWGIIPDMTGARALSELVGIDTAKEMTMTARMFDGDEAYDLGLVTELAADPVADATAFAETIKAKSPDAIAAAKKLFDSTWHTSARRTFARERIEQLKLLLGENAKIAQKAGLKREAPVFKPRR